MNLLQKLTIAIVAFALCASLMALADEPKICQDGCICKNNQIECTGPKFEGFNGKLANYSTILIANISKPLHIQIANLPLAILIELKFENLSQLSFGPALPKQPYVAPKLQRLSIIKTNITSQNLTNFYAKQIKLPALELLDLSQHPNLTLSKEIFPESPKLSTLLLNKLNLNGLKNNAFGDLKNIETLSLTNSLNKVTYVQENLFFNNTKLNKLDLSANSLLDLPSFIKYATAIKVLILDENLFTSLRKADFVNKREVELLSVRRCPNLRKIDELAFEDLPNLRELIIKENPSLKYISEDVFGRKILQNLTIVDLSDNNLTTLSKEVFNDNFKQSLDLRLMGNPWTCDCSLNWLKDNVYVMQSIMHCKTPEIFKNTEFRTAVNSINCSPETVHLGTLSLAFIYVLIMLMVALGIIVFQKRDLIAKKLFHKHQFGTIYYTKASFEQPENP